MLVAIMNSNVKRDPLVQILLVVNIHMECSLIITFSLGGRKDVHNISNPNYIESSCNQNIQQKILVKHFEDFYKVNLRDVTRQLPLLQVEINSLAAIMLSMIILPMMKVDYDSLTNSFKIKFRMETKILTLTLRDDFFEVDRMKVGNACQRANLGNQGNVALVDKFQIGMTTIEVVA